MPPIFCPLDTVCPTETSIEFRCPYKVEYPFPCSIMTHFPYPFPLFDACVTLPLSAAYIGVPTLLATSIALDPEWLPGLFIQLILPEVGNLNLPVPFPGGRAFVPLATSSFTGSFITFLSISSLEVSSPFLYTTLLVSWFMPFLPSVITFFFPTYSEESSCYSVS